MHRASKNGYGSVCRSLRIYLKGRCAPETLSLIHILNYLYSILADRLDFPMTGYQKYLLALSEKIPALCAQGYWGDDGNYYELEDESSPYHDLINEYNILEYNDIFGGKDRDLEFFADVQPD